MRDTNQILAGYPQRPDSESIALDARFRHFCCCKMQFCPWAYNKDVPRRWLERWRPFSQPQ
jgi:hypothetical protein